MDPDGTNEQLLGTGNSPDWSPDGTRIVFWREAPVMYSCGDEEPAEIDVPDIFRMNADGTGVTRLTTSYAACYQSG